MYVKPTQEQIIAALIDHWPYEDAKRGYAIFENKHGLLEINRIDVEYCGWNPNGTCDVDDEDCAIKAERSGFCKIIPVEELPENFEYRYFGWVDTPENREAIQKFCDNHSASTDGVSPRFYQ